MWIAGKPFYLTLGTCLFVQRPDLAPLPLRCFCCSVIRLCTIMKEIALDELHVDIDRGIATVLPNQKSQFVSILSYVDPDWQKEYPPKAYLLEELFRETELWILGILKRIRTESKDPDEQTETSINSNCFLECPRTKQPIGVSPFFGEIKLQKSMIPFVEALNTRIRYQKTLIQALTLLQETTTNIPRFPPKTEIPSIIEKFKNDLNRELSNQLSEFQKTDSLSKSLFDTSSVKTLQSILSLLDQCTRLFIKIITWNEQMICLCKNPPPIPHYPEFRESSDEITIKPQPAPFSEIYHPFVTIPVFFDGLGRRQVQSSSTIFWPSFAEGLFFTFNKLVRMHYLLTYVQQICQNSPQLYSSTSLGNIFNAISILPPQQGQKSTSHSVPSTRDIVKAAGNFPLFLLRTLTKSFSESTSLISPAHIKLIFGQSVLFTDDLLNKFCLTIHNFYDLKHSFDSPLPSDIPASLPPSLHKNLFTPSPCILKLRTFPIHVRTLLSHFTASLSQSIETDRTRTSGAYLHLPGVNKLTLKAKPFTTRSQFKEWCSTRSSPTSLIDSYPHPLRHQPHTNPLSDSQLSFSFLHSPHALRILNTLTFILNASYSPSSALPSEATLSSSPLNDLVFFNIFAVITQAHCNSFAAIFSFHSKRNKRRANTMVLLRNAMEYAGKMIAEREDEKPGRSLLRPIVSFIKLMLHEQQALCLLEIEQEGLLSIQELPTFFFLLSAVYSQIESEQAKIAGAVPDWEMTVLRAALASPPVENVSISSKTASDLRNLHLQFVFDLEAEILKRPKPKAVELSKSAKKKRKKELKKFEQPEVPETIAKLAELRIDMPKQETPLILLDELLPEACSTHSEISRPFLSSISTPTLIQSHLSSFSLTSLKLRLFYWLSRAFHSFFSILSTATVNAEPFIRPAPPISNEISGMGERYAQLFLLNSALSESLNTPTTLDTLKTFISEAEIVFNEIKLRLPEDVKRADLIRTTNEYPPPAFPQTDEERNQRLTDLLMVDRFFETSTVELGGDPFLFIFHVGLVLTQLMAVSTLLSSPSSFHGDDKTIFIQSIDDLSNTTLTELQNLSYFHFYSPNAPLFVPNTPMHHYSPPSRPLIALFASLEVPFPLVFLKQTDSFDIHFTENI
ncbi:hypothetical protein BLNAU_11565 [Blattamonas nauphoetae]|uniref:Uncharacterized protein n=1 Tax=Blattamonas nauphoetae TaxID=2049346 RepID=A0ABQ9XMZ3_9EUKA|nr:hypothetical protein BLNAU_11565 [Blattamonas nauphoetae]